MNGNSGLSLKMRQPLPIMMNIATALIQCVMRMVIGWIFFWRCTGATDTLAIASLSSLVVSKRFVRTMPDLRIAHHSILPHFSVTVARADTGTFSRPSQLCVKLAVVNRRGRSDHAIGSIPADHGH